MVHNQKKGENTRKKANKRTQQVKTRNIYSIQENGTIYTHWDCTHIQKQGKTEGGKTGTGHKRKQTFNVKQEIT